ncbi:PhzF family phenazine biosynthesis protein [Intrasporangium calvum]|uniref:PhzF family phenazine biosynthesis protein n=1 Tax=Intrasporangium calvum TaxID=53358 RepID=A0ABT5GCP5_9MICO|nr:PhzF family phenazine biosynthesis protein [Intrasporangium calvum]MDC5695655.1 PhzF family phenazine biosynthesis protein [Intrasporangium calvum]
MTLRFRLLNVFSVDGDPFSGNPLCVFEEAGSLDDAQLQAWARQFNLSETTFITAADLTAAEADVRIFTASYEMPFAGHPTLGTAHVVADLAAAGGARPAAVTLSMPAGRIPVERIEGGWRLRASAAVSRPLERSPAEVAAVLGIDDASVVVGGAHWVDAGVEQLIIELTDAGAVAACTPDVRGLHGQLSVPGREPQVYVWAWTGESTVTSRLFAASGSALEEDPATGSAAANLGSHLALSGRRGQQVTISQGAQVGRPSRLDLAIDEEGTVFVGGRVTEVGSGTVAAGT